MIRMGVCLRVLCMLRRLVKNLDWMVFGQDGDARCSSDVASRATKSLPPVMTLPSEAAAAPGVSASGERLEGEEEEEEEVRESPGDGDPAASWTAPTRSGSNNPRGLDEAGVDVSTGEGDDSDKFSAPDSKVIGDGSSGRVAGDAGTPAGSNLSGASDVVALDGVSQDVEASRVGGAPGGVTDPRKVGEQGTSEVAAGEAEGVRAEQTKVLPLSPAAAAATHGGDLPFSRDNLRISGAEDRVKHPVVELSSRGGSLDGSVALGGRHRARLRGRPRQRVAVRLAPDGGSLLPPELDEPIQSPHERASEIAEVLRSHRERRMLRNSPVGKKRLGSGDGGLSEVLGSSRSPGVRRSFEEQGGPVRSPARGFSPKIARTSPGRLYGSPRSTRSVPPGFRENGGFLLSPGRAGIWGARQGGGPGGVVGFGGSDGDQTDGDAGKESAPLARAREMRARGEMSPEEFEEIVRKDQVGVC